MQELCIKNYALCIIKYIAHVNILYYILYAIIYVLSLLPFRVLYVLSDGLYLLVYKLAGYRRRLVAKNLRESFPEKNEAELKDIERKFYHWFGDYVVESIKLMSISPEKLKRRMVFKNIDTVNQILAEGQSVALFLGHYCNWEWITSLPLWITEDIHGAQIYHTLENAAFDRLFLKMRQRMGSACIPMAETMRRIWEYNQDGKPMLIGYICDQVPFWNNIHHWCDFLNHDTPVLTGTERLARKTNHAAVYIDVTRPRRGYYVAEMKLITRQPKQTKEFEITDTYFSLLEQSIRRAPQYWLWTHNRWKRTHEEFNLRYDESTGRVDIVSSVEELKRKKNLL